MPCMNIIMSQNNRGDVCLWCDGYSGDADSCQLPSQKRRKKDDSGHASTKCGEKEKEVDDLTSELRDIHGSESYSDPQYRLWARMIANGIHSSMEVPPQVPMITGITPTRKAKKSIEETIASTVTAVVKAMNSASQQPSALAIPATPVQCTTNQAMATVGVSPSKSVDIRGKCLAQLSNLKQLLDESILTEEEVKEQKGCILGTLRKLN